jgi:hypothetical protein
MSGPDRRPRAAVLLVALAFLRSAAVGGAVVTFLALSGAVSRRTTLWLVLAVVVSSSLVALGGLALVRCGSARPSDRA